MAVFIELTTDTFAESFNSEIDVRRKNAQDSNYVLRAGNQSVRRPMRGLEIKDDTYAIIKVIQADGTPIPLLDSGSKTGTSEDYANFILQSVQEARMEKHQIVETFGEPYIYFFGESPRFLDVRAILISSNDFDWYAEFWENYDRYLRGTRLVEQGARTYLMYDDNIVEGYMLNAQAQQDSMQPLTATLTFRLYLTSYRNIRFVGDPRFPTRASALPPDVTLTASDLTFEGVAKTALTGNVVAATNQLTQLGQRQLNSGFGGGRSLTQALRENAKKLGADPITDPLLDALGIALNITDNVIRTKPTRELIAANTDEFTSPDVNNPAPQKSIKETAIDLAKSSIKQLALYGANINEPDPLSKLGLSPKFITAPSFGLRGSSGTTATFGPPGMGSGFMGGINGGLGFTGLFTPSSFINSSFSSSKSTPPNISVPSNQGVYGNGVPVASGIVQGTGIGGGIPGGVQNASGPSGQGTLTKSMGMRTFASSSGFVSSQGYGQGLSANGAAVNVGGTPSAFGFIVAKGTLNPHGTNKTAYFTGPGGVQVDHNMTGVTV